VGRPVLPGLSSRPLAGTSDKPGQCSYLPRKGTKKTFNTQVISK
jgi:hypothetical protein